MSASTELSPITEQAVSGWEAVERAFPVERQKQIAEFLEVKPDDPAFLPFLVIAAQHGLNPIFGEIWLIETKGKNGEHKRKRPMAGRDGLLKIARRDPSFKGLQGDVVCANDEYSIEWTGDPENDPVVRHRHAPKPMAFAADDDPRAWRGAILGAWAKAWAVGRFPMFYWAPLKEHGRTGSRDDGSKYWQGAWPHTSAMILKAAQSLVLRTMWGITGLVPIDELNYDPAMVDGETENSLDDIVIDWGDDGSLAEKLRAAVDRANEAEPNAYTPAQLQMLLGGRDVEAREQVLQRIERDAELFEARNAERERKAAEVEEVADAEVVPDGEPEEVTALRHRLLDAQSVLDEDPENAVALADRDEAESRLRELGASDPAQASLDVS